MNTSKITKFLLALFLVISSSLFAQDAKEQWMLNYDKAVQKAKTEHKNILMSFSGSDWCLPCMKLEKEVFDTEAFLNYAADHYVLLKLDFPSKKKNALSKEQLAHNEQLAEKYNQDGSFPKVVVLSTDGKIIGESKYRAGGAVNFIDFLKTL